MQRVVLDSNVFIAAAFNAKSASARIIDMVRSGKLTHVWHERTRAETKKLMEQIPPIDFEPFADVFGEDDEFTGQLGVKVMSWIEDPDDRKFAVLSQETNAVIVTNDDHLLSVSGKISVLTPRDFLNSLK